MKYSQQIDTLKKELETQKKELETLNQNQQETRIKQGRLFLKALEKATIQKSNKNEEKKT